MKNLVLRLIDAQPNGVKIAEMEKALRQSRLHIGYITKVLVDEGKVRKVDNKYFPVGIQKSEEE